ncbi:MAG: NAD(P)-dependent oxidoreductase [Candidatus Cloacimonetes bacterium]|nr:NAD(P)-dependent oxidoreductase [Candidatus Cloacimonadota bacterium]
MKKIVVTGAAGFTGMNLVAALLAAGYFVYALVRPGSSHNARLNDGRQLKKIEIDVSELSSLAEYIQEPCDGFIHLAWGYGGRDDMAAQQINISHVLNAVEAAAAVGCKRFIASGSQAEYGSQAVLTNENCLPCPLNAYGAAKLAACHLSKIRAKQLGLEWIWGRIFSTYGPYEPEGRMLPDLVNSLKRGEAFQLSSCVQMWDYLYAGDAASAFIALLQRGCSGEIYNIANGDIHPLRYFTQLVLEEYGQEGKLCYGEATGCEMSLLPDVKKLRVHTGWRPVVSFSEGIKSYSEE